MSAHEIASQPDAQVRKGAPVRTAVQRSRKPLFEQVAPYLFIAPHMLFFLGFVVIPVFFGLYISLFNWSIFGEAEFTGLKNYANLFSLESHQGSNFWKAMQNTAGFVLYSVPLLVVIPLAIAVALNQPIRGRVFFRTIFYAPVILSVATVAIIWRWMMDTNAGLVNYYLSSWFGVDAPVPWLVVQPFATMFLVIMTMWWTIGGNMVLFLAGLQGIPDSVLEAASLDGANGWRRFLHVVLPLLKPTMLFVIVMTTIASFNLFGQPYMTTGNGPDKTTMSLVMLIRGEAFKDFRMGSASAMAWIMGLIMMVISVIQFRLMKDQVEY
jgi:multiple sugar transport system permease protein